MDIFQALNTPRQSQEMNAVPPAGVAIKAAGQTRRHNR